MDDLIIIGGSVAAETAGIYAARRGLKFKIVSKNLGGEVLTSGEIGNWPGIISINGVELAGKFKEHLLSYKPAIDEGVFVEKIERQGDGTFIVTGNSGGNAVRYQARTVLISTGLHPKQLNVPGEKELRNKGLSYCTVCDGPLFAGKTATVIGGGNSALEAALMLSDIATQVYVLNKNPGFKGEEVLIKNLAAKKNVQVVYNAMTTEIVAGQNGFVAAVRYNDQQGQIQELATDGVFVHIGQIPNTSFIPQEVGRDEFGQIKVGMSGETNIPGFYAAGDVTNLPHKQIIIAAGQGCAAVLSAVQYLNRITP